MSAAGTQPPTELGEIQANVLRGFRNADALPLAEYVFVQLGLEAESRAFLGALHPEITSCAHWDAGDRVVVNVGLTYAGLLLLTGRAAPLPQPPQPPCALATFDAFKEGSEARSQRTPALGDTGASHPNHWESHYTNPALHAVISLSADTPRGLAAARRVAATALANLAPPAGEIGRERGTRLNDGPRQGIEHFGFVDGIGQPDIADAGLPPDPGGGTPEPNGVWRQLPLGEFVLGYPNARKIVQGNALLKNGSFVVFRKLRQDVPRFREFLEALAARTQQSAAHLAARFVGRWQSGAPLILAPAQDDPPLGADPTQNNDFRYSGDPHGIACPIGAHIRRANPRDEPTGPTIAETETRRMIRRGIPYGRLLPAGARPDHRERGLLFVAVVADIEQQFEFVQASWINSTLSSSLLTLDADKDPIIGANDETGKFAMPGLPEPTFAWKLPRFVSVKGSAYFFWPSLGAIKQLSEGTVAPADWPFGSPLEQPRIVRSPALRLVGLAERYEGSNAGIPAQWGRFEPQLGAIAARDGDDTFGAMYDYDEAGTTFTYLCAVAVKKFPAQLGALTKLELPARRYAVWQHRDHVSLVADTCQQIFEHGLASAGLTPEPAPMFERYGDAFDARTGNGGLEVWVPVKA